MSSSIESIAWPLSWESANAIECAGNFLYSQLFSHLTNMCEERACLRPTLAVLKVALPTKYVVPFAFALDAAHLSAAVVTTEKWAASGFASAKRSKSEARCMEPNLCSFISLDLIT